MAQLPGPFNPTDHKPLGDGEPLPAGEYLLAISAAEIRHCKDEHGNDRMDTQMLSITYDVAEGEHRGRNLWDNLLLRHSSTKAVEIASRKLADLCRAANIESLSDTDQLMGRVFCAKIKHEVQKGGKYEGRVSAVISAYKPQGAAPAAQPAPTGQPSGGSAGSW